MILTKQTITDGNNKIAEFLGWTFIPRDYGFWKFWNSYPDHWLKPNGERVQAPPFYYDSNELLDVVDTIESMGYVFHLEKYRLRIMQGDNTVVDITEHTNIHDLFFQAVAAFATWWKKEPVNEPDLSLQES